MGILLRFLSLREELSGLAHKGLARSCAHSRLGYRAHLQRPEPGWGADL
jgi:hypothetical protein